MNAAVLTSDTASYWQRHSQTTLDSGLFAPLVGATTVDVVIIGGGVSGLTAALKLRAEGASVIVLEAAEICRGASANGSGIVAPALLHWNAARLRRLPPASRERFVALLAASAEKTIELVSHYDLPIEVRPARLTVLTKPSQPTSITNDDLQIWTEYAASTNTTAHPKFNAASHREFIEWGGTYRLDPSAFVRQLTLRCHNLGVRIHKGSPALGYGRGGRRWVVTTPEGRLDARALFVATNALARQYSTRIASDILSSVEITDAWFIATRPLPNELRSRIMADDQCIAAPTGALRTLAWTNDGSLLLGLSPGLKRGHSRIRAVAISQLVNIVGSDVANAISKHFDHIWCLQAAITDSGAAQFHTVGPDGYAWIGGPPGDISLSVAVGSEIANAIQSGGAANLALPLSEIEPIPYRRMRALFGLPLLRRRNSY